jgi:sRNA-binding carbon storage regulator CsrA
VRNGQVRLGIDAPRGVSIVREEIFSSAAGANREAVSPVLGDDHVEVLALMMRLRLSNSGRGDNTCDAGG